MPHMTITPAGYAAVQEAIRTGTPIQPLTFQAGTGTGYNLLSELTGVSGNMVFEGRIDHATALNEDTVSFSGMVPGYVEGVAVGEVVLFLGADAFAIGTLSQAYTKYRGFSFRFHGFVQALGIGVAINTDYNATSPLPKRLTYASLAEADLEIAPVLGVLSGQQAGVERGPSLVVKSSHFDDEAKWLVVNGTMAHRGTPQSASSSTFTFATADFSGIGYAIAMVHVTTGPGKGQTRHVSGYDETTNTYTVDSSFSPAITVESTLELWSGVGPCYGAWNNGCAATLDYDLEDPLPTPLPDPDPLCEPEAVTTPVRPQIVPATIGVDTQPVLLGGGPYTQPLVVSRLGVHLSDWPICSPYDEPGAFAAAPNRALPATDLSGDNRWRYHPPIKGLIDRLRVDNPLWADRVFAGVFDPEVIAATNFDRKPFYTPAYASESITSVPASCVKLQAVPIAGGDGTVINYVRSTRMAEGSYADLEASAVAALGLPVGTALQSQTMVSGLNVGPRTLDSILVPAHYRLVIYEDKNFRGRVLLDVTGPIYIINYMVLSTTVRLELQQAQVTAGLVTSSSAFPNVVATGVDQMWWPLKDSVWRGPIGQSIPARNRFCSSMRLFDANGSPQATDWLLEPNMRLWRGSARVILL